MSASFDLRGVYSFSTVAPNILGDAYRNATVVGILDFESANREMDVTAMFKQVMPYITESSAVRNPRTADYIRVRLENGNTTILATAWIKTDTVQKKSSQSIKITIPNATPADLNTVRMALQSNGIMTYDIDIE